MKIFKKRKKGFTLVELLAVIVVLAVVILIAVTAVIPRMNSARKKALVDEALMYLNAAKESYAFGDGVEGSSSCINVNDLNGKYISKSDDNYKGVIKTIYKEGYQVTQIINLTDGKNYIIGSDNIVVNDVKSTKPKSFAETCADFNPILFEDANEGTLAHKLIMSEGGSTFDDNIEIINQKSSNIDFTTVESNPSNSGLYHGEDDDGASYYYRGVVNNNWVEFGGFYWRVIRINGDGSIRLIYSGTSNSSHTGDDALIKNSKNSTTTSFIDTTTYNINVNDISGLTNNSVATTLKNYGSGNTFVGYMYNPARVLKTYPDRLPNNEQGLDTFNYFANIKNTNTYYFFKDFDMNRDCNVGSGIENGTCILKCRRYGNDGDSGIDCISGTWDVISTKPGNYSTTAPGSTSSQYIYTSDYKYTCWNYGTPKTITNSDGTKSVYITCPLVSEILGTINGNTTRALVRHHGLISSSSDAAYSNVADSNVKKEIDLWYESNILNRKDSNNTNFLEEYLADEIFCNDRTSTIKDFPLTDTGRAYTNSFYDRVLSLKKPTLKCPNILRDAFTLNNSGNGIVSSKRIGNQSLKYPVGMVTADELYFAGANYNINNPDIYLNVGKDYWAMTPVGFNATNALAISGTLTSTGSLYIISVVSNNRGVRPVINLKADILYDSGSGTETSPYKVKLPTT